MKKILFVCHGNICRSPMAEFIMKKLVCDAGLEGEYYIASAAVSNEEIGNGIYPPAQRELSRRGVPFSDHRAVKVRKEEYDNFDLFVVMDRSNVFYINNIFGGDPDGKVHMLLEYAGEDCDVRDPWYSRRFDIAFDDIYRGCEGLLEKLQKNT